MKRNLKFSGRFALTSVAAAMLMLAAPWASALGLGRLSVQSALGEAMQAEIEVTSMTADEQANLAASVPGFIAAMQQELAETEGYNIGVITTDLYILSLIHI